MSLDQSQIAVVESTEPVVVVKAGPGAGKTTTLIAVVERLAESIPPADIHVVTFSRQAAEEIRHRSRRLVGVDITTAHGLAYRVVSQNHEALGYSRKPALYSELERRVLAEEVVKQMPRSSPVLISNLLSCLHSLASGQIQREAIVGPLALAVQTYELMLRRDGAADYGLIMLDAVRGQLRKNSDTWKCGALVVDEAQDIDRAQAALLGTFAPGRVVLVGDTDQCIYGWRGACPEWMGEMPGVHLSLSHTYRCPANIIHAAGVVLGSPRDVIPAGEGGVVEVIEERIWPHQIPDEGSVAVLCRSNEDADNASTVLQGSGVPFTRITAGDRILESVDVRQALALTLWPELPDAAWVGDLVQRVFGISKLGWSRIDLRAANEGITRFKAACELVQGIRGFYEQAGDSILERLTDAMGMVRMGEKDERTSKWLSLHAATFVRSTDPSERTAVNLWWYLAGCDGKLPTEKPGRVQVLTMHSSKGMEFDTVFLYGKGRDRNPTPEERRLLYVAVTRARKRVVAVDMGGHERAWYVQALQDALVVERKEPR